MLGFDQPAEQLVAQRGLQHFDARAGQVERLLAAVQARDLAAVELREQLRVAIGDQVDEVLVQRFLGGVGVRRLHRRRGGFRIAVPRA